ncbi:sugar ABC transporter substrate-binding protein [Lactonifactor longoviformis]|uniref:sugar ABC transporter substrate-binding protein n=1 Tax=Lactonifactor longoviformis TaxID=341220 RepID=UPI0036F31B11
MKRSLSWGICCVLAVVLIIKGIAGSGEEAQRPQRAAVILKGLTTSYWYAVKSGAEDASRELGVDVDIMAPVKADSNELQLQLLEEAVGSQYDVICISPADSKGILPGIELANDAGIPVINYATPITGDVQVASFIRIQDFDAEYTVAKKLCEMIQEGEVIILEGPAGQQNAQDKTEGAKAAIKEFPGIQLAASQTANWIRNEAFVVTQNLLQAHPDIKGIIACNDDMAVGASEAVETAGKKGEIYISGMNCAVFALEALKEGKIQVTIDVMAYELGYEAVAVAKEIMDGQNYEKDIVMETELCDLSNVEEMLKKHRRIEGK